MQQAENGIHEDRGGLVLHGASPRTSQNASEISMTAMTARRMISLTADREPLYGMHLEAAKSGGSAVRLLQLDPITKRITHIPAVKSLQRLILFQLVSGLFKPL